ncbi:hypothetical protein E2C01_047555 [Portunus trituberculatus]|uniref:Peptidase A2 domain-containing protein n=1 Tax=Portunus trituberculatus TaxID=210409 RepID=A0A5B7G7W6_PORTR|nr:hypothetical protein [Portunus trituberculatus]
MNVGAGHVHWRIGDGWSSSLVVGAVGCGGTIKSQKCCQPKDVVTPSGNMKQLGASKASDAIKVAGSINGHRVEVVVDIGAERTFVREGVLLERGVKRVREQLCRVTVPVKGPVWVRLAVGKVTECLPIFVAEMKDECLLDLYYLNRVGSVCRSPGR